MTTLTYAMSDSMTMLRRNFRHMVRYPVVTFLVVGIPVILLLMFVYVFGGTLGDGLGVGTGGRAAYVNYVVPGIILMAVAGVAQGTAISVAMDMTGGIIARFRTMGISRGSVLTGHVLGSTIQTMLGLGVVIGVALAIGFRPDAGPVEWIAAIGVFAMVTVAITWLSVALGLLPKSVEAASNLAMPPDAPIIETVRGLLMGTPIGNSALIAVAWCVGVTLVGYRWAMKLYNRDPSA